LTTANGRLNAAAARAQERATARLRVLAGRLDSLSPLAVLARGYAVCWNADRTAIIHSSAAVVPGDRVRVTLHEGELHCDVRKAE
jgi:exodeoxyribonuclease VII large subunit